MTRALSMVLVLVSACGFEAAIPGSAGSQPDAQGADAAEVATAPWLAHWSRRKAITLHASQIEAPGNGALTDFPVAIRVTDAAIAAAALASGDDIVFTGADAVTPLASEIEAFSKSTGELVAWVKVPSLSATADTTIYVYYGNPTPPARAPETVWNTGYVGVWHLQQDPGPGGTGDIRDATASNRDGTPQSNMVSNNRVAAQLGPGIYFDGAQDYIDYNTVDLGNSFTISMWIRYNDHFSCNTLFANTDSGRDSAGIKFFVNSVNTTNRRLVVEVGNGNVGNGQIAETADNAIPLDTFTHVAAVVDRTMATARIYVNGQMVATDTSITNDFRTASDFALGRMENALFYFQGVQDEVEIASTQRPGEWIQTTYNNQAQPSTFHTLGSEELEP